MEFVNGKHVRRISNPSLEAAVVYDSSNGNTSTVAKGGKEVHEALREAFARKLLKIEPKFDAVRKRRFLLDSASFEMSLGSLCFHHSVGTGALFDSVLPDCSLIRVFARLAVSTAIAFAFLA